MARVMRLEHLVFGIASSGQYECAKGMKRLLLPSTDLAVITNSEKWPLLLDSRFLLKMIDMS